jgi:hypothetical protein
MKSADLVTAMLAVLQYGCASRRDLGSVACAIKPLYAFL